MCVPARGRQRGGCNPSMDISGGVVKSVFAKDEDSVPRTYSEIKTRYLIVHRRRHSGDVRDVFVLHGNANITRPPDVSRILFLGDVRVRIFTFLVGLLPPGAGLSVA